LGDVSSDTVGAVPHQKRDVFLLSQEINVMVIIFVNLWTGKTVSFWAI